MATKEVRFDIYCPKCVHYEKTPAEDPCWDCLNQGWNTDSHKPICYEGKEVANETSTNMKTNQGGE